MNRNTKWEKWRNLFHSLDFPIESNRGSSPRTELRSHQMIKRIRRFDVNSMSVSFRQCCCGCRWWRHSIFLTKMFIYNSILILFFYCDSVRWVRIYDNIVAYWIYNGFDPTIGMTATGSFSLKAFCLATEQLRSTQMPFHPVGRPSLLDRSSQIVHLRNMFE